MRNTSKLLIFKEITIFFGRGSFLHVQILHFSYIIYERRIIVHIDGVNFNNAMNTAAINANITAQAQRIIDIQINAEMQRLREQNQTLQTAQMLNPIENRLNMIPTYPNTFAYNAGANPFCNCVC